jgi:hypothetical protein
VSLYPYWPICSILSALVKDSEGLMVAVQPETQIVDPIVVCETAGLSARGSVWDWVRRAIGRLAQRRSLAVGRQSR